MKAKHSSRIYKIAFLQYLFVLLLGCAYRTGLCFQIENFVVKIFQNSFYGFVCFSQTGPKMVSAFVFWKS